MFVFSPELMVKHRADAVARKLAIFGAGGKPDGLYRIGRHADLLGRSVDQIFAAQAHSASDSGVTVELDRPWFLDAVDLTGRFLPAQLSGRVRSERISESPLELAVAVNGVIQAVTETFDEGRAEARFTAMAPEDSFVQGRNQVDFFVVNATAGGPELEPARNISAQGFALTRSWGSEAIRTADGRLLPVGGGVAACATKMKARYWTGAWVSGCVVSCESLEPPHSIVVFADNRFIAAGQPGRQPEPGSAAKPEALRQAGFKIRLPDAVLKDSADPRLRLFAVFGDSAAELGPKRNCP